MVVAHRLDLRRVLTVVFRLIRDLRDLGLNLTLNFPLDLALDLTLDLALDLLDVFTQATRKHLTAALDLAVGFVAAKTRNSTSGR
ncbi:MAG TPA: hypothetical protein VHC71_14965 [Hyphomicrobium sp.]|nr:hypothetical protein [Hyphomicrobium sp.]